MPTATASTIRFDGVAQQIDRWTVLRLPDDASRKLPSRGQVAVRGTINGSEFATVIEPDGQFGHWLKIDEKLRRRAGVRMGAATVVKIEPTKDWPEPIVPSDMREALSRAPIRIREMWLDITPMARWEWVRWVNATNNPVTRKRRVEVTISKMKSGKRRPCCFDLASCTDPELSRNGKLREQL